jgi:hypothetical protein
MDRDIWLHTDLLAELTALPSPTKDRLMIALRCFASYGPEDAGLISTPVYCDPRDYPDWSPRMMRTYHIADNAASLPVLLTLVKDFGRSIFMLGFLDDLLPTESDLVQARTRFHDMDKTDSTSSIAFARHYNHLPIEDLDHYESATQTTYKQQATHRTLHTALHLAAQDMGNMLGLSERWIGRLETRLIYFLQRLHAHLQPYNIRLCLTLEKDGKDLLRLTPDALTPSRKEYL